MKKIIITLIAIVSLCTLTGCAPDTQETLTYQDGTTMLVRRFKMDGYTIIELAHPTDQLWYDNFTGFVYDSESLKKIVKEAIEEYMEEHNK